MSQFRLFLCTLMAAVSVSLVPSGAATAEKRVALVVGNAAYKETAKLANPVNDANEIAAALKASGFDVILGLDLDKREFDTKVRNFAHLVENADVAIFFYAGHGLQVAGRNYLIPVDASLQNERDLDFDAQSLDFILKQMELDRADKTNIVFLDACRDNPFSRNLARSMGTRSTSIGKGLAQVDTGVGTFIAYSTQPGNVALDGHGQELAVHYGPRQARACRGARSNLSDDRYAQGRAGGDRRQTGAVGPFGADRRVLLPPHCSPTLDRRGPTRRGPHPRRARATPRRRPTSSRLPRRGSGSASCRMLIRTTSSSSSTSSTKPAAQRIPPLATISPWR